MQIFFYKFFKNFQKSLMSRFVLNVFSQPKFWRRHCSTGLERNSCMKFLLMFPPPPKFWRRPCIQYCMSIFMFSLVPPPRPNFYTWRTPWNRLMFVKTKFEVYNGFGVSGGSGSFVSIIAYMFENIVSVFRTDYILQTTEN